MSSAILEVISILIGFSIAIGLTLFRRISRRKALEKKINAKLQKLDDALPGDIIPLESGPKRELNGRR